MFATPLGNLRNKKRFVEKFWKYKDEENGKDEDYTMLQYLNLLNNNGCKDKAPAHFKPKYCNSSEELNKAWTEACTYFKKLHDEIYNNISSAIELNKEKHDILKKHNIVNKNNIKEYEDEKAYLESILTHTRNEIMINTAKINDYNLDYFKVFYKLFKTEKYLAYSSLLHQQEEKINHEKAIITKIDDFKRLIIICGTLAVSYNFLEEEGFDIKNFEEDWFWQNWQENFNDLNKITPYFNPMFEILRSNLFISAVKLHEIFINANADIFWHSLKYFFDVAIHSSGKPEMNKIAWQNFFMVIPVVSTTFHSFDRMFATADHNEVPWLFIDEAGQIPPQYAASAIYKSNKVIVVGDPLQTEPISILKQDLIKKLCENFKVSYYDWSPSEVSLQNLADRNSLYQTKIDDTTVGFPLLVHRRCQNPMFSICNKIAYGNKMIFATSNCKSDIRDILGVSKWIDVKDNKIQRYKYESEAEFQKLLHILMQILAEKDWTNLLKQIYIITMYKDYSESVRRKLSEIYEDSKFEKIIKEFGNNNIGMIHAFQGKENDTVIMMLGAQHPEDKGARSIMTSKPNVLNVGISRAKNNLYVIGNAELWLKHKYMQEIYNMLS
ncbi:DEAD/DEAH box helicase [Rickettsia endosymbiont of Seladonia tumulorum]|uniref:DEAD/DEAH box helicase n=1 Tax=Rickettsia endosymbiont of Seladonia tumulorum TaxID=3066270 RepID=UPI00313D07C0